MPHIPAMVPTRVTTMNLYEPMTIDGARWSVVRRLDRGDGF